MARDDAATLPTASVDRVLATRPTLVATIACHPDPARVGERAVLGPLDSAKIELSRHAPEFFARHRVAGLALEDRSVSRRPLRIESRADGSALSADDEVSVHVDGVRLDGTRCAERAIVRLGRVVLVLHASSAIARGGRNDHGLVGASDAVERVRDHVDRVAPEQVSVLLRGASGVGKELVARAIHRASTRADRPFVALNMAALPAGTAAAELFGHTRGGYTGAVGEHRGAFGAADGGTLFLDEIGAIEEGVQSMLLRALETGEVRQVGGRDVMNVDVRVVAATDADLDAEVRAGRFRLPLYYRLAAYELSIPPLSERPEDVGLLLLHFVNEALGKPLAASDDPWLPAALVERLLLHDWPGNVRELRNTARQIVIASRGAEHAILPENLATPVERPARAPAREGGLDAIGEDEVVKALRDHAWEPTAAARALGISKVSMYQLMARCPGVRSAKDLEAEEILATQRACEGDVRRMAEHLRVSKRALKRRMTELGIGGRAM